jgi:hypothetical protein
LINVFVIMLGGGTSQFMSFPKNWEKASIFSITEYHTLELNRAWWLL